MTFADYPSAVCLCSSFTRFRSLPCCQRCGSRRKWLAEPTDMLTLISGRMFLLISVVLVAPVVARLLSVPAKKLVTCCQASCGGTHTMVLTAEGRIFGWGRGSFGRLGTGLEKDCYSPIEVFLPGTTHSCAGHGLSNITFVFISTYTRHTLNP